MSRIYVCVFVLLPIYSNCGVINYNDKNSTEEISTKFNSTIFRPYERYLSARIMGGTDVDDKPEKSFNHQLHSPFMVYLIYFPYKNSLQNTQSCGAALISSKFLLSAAHCFFPKEPLNVNGIRLVAGKSYLDDYQKERLQIPFQENVDEKKFELQERRAEKVIINPGFNHETYKGDIAIIKVKGKFDLNEKIWPIEYSSDRLYSRRHCLIMGWGQTGTPNDEVKLRMGIIEVHSNTVLNRCRFKDLGPFICSDLSSQRICHGDSGSPLICDQMIWGIASHGSNSRSKSECIGYEQYFTEISYYAGWLEMELFKEGAFDKSSTACLNYTLYFVSQLLIVFTFLRCD